MDASDHRAVAVEQFNRAWDLLDDGRDRDDEEDLELLLAAATSRWHWDRLDDPTAGATGDWQLARVLAMLGAGPLSLRFATRCLDAVIEQGATGWRLASAHEGVARALAVCGDGAGRDEHVAAARTALAAEADDEDRAVIEAQLDDVPPTS